MTQPFQPPAAGDDTSSLYAPHHREGRFFNPWRPWSIRPVDVFRWYRSRPRRRPPESPAPRVPNDGASLRLHEPGVTLTWVGHSSFAIHHERSVLLTDPHFGPRALVPPRHVAPGIPLSALPVAPVVVLSHSHYDHLDRWTVRRLPPETRWLVPLGLEKPLRSMGARHARELDWWDETVEGPWRFTCVPVQHWSRRLSHPRDSTLWCGWLIEGGGRSILFAGDTGWFPGFRELGRRFPTIDAAILPIGAYEPRWFMRYQHLDPAEAVAAWGQLGARRLVGMHWGTFILTDEPMDAAPGALTQAIAEAGADATAAHVLAVGERLTL
jgi:N-acyl-phosphatidylethanolamine-hydrolysing phospholipase D